MKIEALYRLLASADEQQARAFIAHMAGIQVGPLELSAPGVIRFSIDAYEFDQARDTLIRKLGKPDRSRVPGSSKGGQWALSGSHFIVLGDSPIGRKSNSQWFISLVDNFHKETPAQMMRRLKERK